MLAQGGDGVVRQRHGSEQPVGSSSTCAGELGGGCQQLCGRRCRSEIGAAVENNLEVAADLKQEGITV
jgi:hypothetical protein